MKSTKDTLNKLKKETKQKNTQLVKEMLGMIDFFMKKIYRIGSPVLILISISLILFVLHKPTGIFFFLLVLAFYVVPLFLILFTLIYLVYILNKLYKTVKDI